MPPESGTAQARQSFFQLTTLSWMVRVSPNFNRAAMAGGRRCLVCRALSELGERRRAASVSPSALPIGGPCRRTAGRRPNAIPTRLLLKAGSDGRPMRERRSRGRRRRGASQTRRRASSEAYRPTHPIPLVCRSLVHEAHLRTSKAGALRRRSPEPPALEGGSARYAGGRAAGCFPIWRGDGTLHSRFEAPAGTARLGRPAKKAGRSRRLRTSTARGSRRWVQQRDQEFLPVLRASNKTRELWLS
jgi:hypothetical protein